MVLHKEHSFSIFFGDATNCTVAHQAPEFKDSCQELCKSLALKNLVLDHQTHSATGFFIDKNTVLNEPVILFERDGDFLITDQPRVGIGVLTADCLPVIIYDTKNNIIAIAHAGWKGSVAEISIKVIEAMLSRVFFKPQDLKIFFGPSAKKCCYEVQPDFLTHLEKCSFKSSLIEQRDNKLFFDNPLINKLQLIGLGIKPDQIDMSMNLCTMCSPNFHSFRIKKTANVCQTTLAWLK